MPLLAARARPARRPAAGAPRAAELTAELVELLRGAPELVVYGREEEALARVRAADRELVRLGRRDALAAGLADGLVVLVAGATTVGVLAVAVAAHDAGHARPRARRDARAARAVVVRGGRSASRPPRGSCRDARAPGGASSS